MLITLTLFIALSVVIQNNLGAMDSLLKSVPSLYAMPLFVVLGIVTVMVPFGSILPFMPLAVHLWGWPVTGLLTLIAWVLGGQMLFEFSRAVGKPVIKKMISEEKMKAISSLVDKKGIFNALMIRMFVHEDLVSYAFGMFSNISRWAFLFVTVVGVAPGAFLYAYFGSLPILYEVAFATLGISGLVGYWMWDEKKGLFKRRSVPAV